MTDKTREPGTVHRQKARKQHDCAECADPILKGQSYIYLNTFDEVTRRWSKYLLCSECERIRSCNQVAELETGHLVVYSAGSMRRDVKTNMQFHQPYKRAFLGAWADAVAADGALSAPPIEATQ